MKTSASLLSQETSITPQLIQGTQRPSKNIGSCNDCGSLAGNISSEPGSSPRSKLSPPRIVWQFWRMAGRQSDYHNRGAPNEIDLGEIF